MTDRSNIANKLIPDGEGNPKAGIPADRLSDVIVAELVDGNETRDQRESGGANPARGENPNSAAQTAPNLGDQRDLDDRQDRLEPSVRPLAKPRSRISRLRGGVTRSMVGTFRFVSLVILLALLTAVPIFQLITLGYLVDIAGKLAGGAKLGDALAHRRQAGTIVLAILAVIVAALPSQLLAHWEFVAQSIDPGSVRAGVLRSFALAFSFLAMGYLMWAWIRGGRLKHYLWPQPIRLLREGWRWRTWSGAADRLWDFTASLQLPRLLWLGLRCAVGTLVWLIPAVLIIVLNRNGTNGLAGLAGAVSLLALGVALFYLPMLQAHFASQNKLLALFDVRAVRRDFRRAPWAWLGAMFVTLVITPIPLYLLKIEATPREVVWLPCLVFVTFMIPARIAAGAALRRARRRPDPVGIWAALSRWTVRLVMPIVVGIYLAFLYVSQYTSWDGLQTWVQQHAILVPLPFTGI